ncbi:hypothetical protein J2Y69_003099 [Microbacterium resistens]|uniref:Uncharacterized protein n=1 Tax=Microbacterium resistens TaxID=156977 RepID=A0ABU1SFV6_9MICO|nr:hypothetical protein [Microbacterium resistens]MDR6868480.1 hypothetical protein [Microbacterium resistens]
MTMLFSGCASLRGPADRTDRFVAAGQDCIGSWWIDDLREGTREEARSIAERALEEDDVSEESLESARSLLDMSMNEQERRNTSDVAFGSEAYMLAVTLHVKNELDEAGYPDIDRVLEVWSDHTCS